NYGKMLADFLYIAALTPEDLPRVLSVDGEEYPRRAVSEGTGAILALPHMGSWDFAGGLGSTLGFPLSAVAESFPGSLNDAVVEGRRRLGLEVIPLDRSAVRAIFRALDAGRLVALLCDLPPPGGSGVEVAFFGRRAVVPAGPASIALKRGVPLIPVFCRRDGADHYHVHCDPPVPAPEGARRDASTAMMQEVVRRFETFISAHPEQWYAFKRVLR
ncbi:MAG: lysophospholipid acyltransferase family protein, partial [Candidatus Dormibacteraeota bacterium]|nr:lysophospholipid acyltransferase family protein [Candidatus Dormibacteraeota bacterium]